MNYSLTWMLPKIAYISLNHFYSFKKNNICQYVKIHYICSITTRMVASWEYNLQYENIIIRNNSNVTRIKMLSSPVNLSQFQLKYKQSIMVHIPKHCLTVLNTCQVACFLGTERSLQNPMKFEIFRLAHLSSFKNGMTITAFYRTVN